MHAGKQCHVNCEFNVHPVLKLEYVGPVPTYYAAVRTAKKKPRNLDHITLLFELKTGFA